MSVHTTCPGLRRDITFTSSTASQQKQRFKGINKPKANNTSAHFVQSQLFSCHNQSAKTQIKPRLPSLARLFLLRSTTGAATATWHWAEQTTAQDQWPRSSISSETPHGSVVPPALTGTTWGCHHAGGTTFMAQAAAQKL